MESAPKDRRQSARLAGRPGPPILMDPPRAEPNITMEGQNVNQNLLERLNESTEDRRQRLKRIIQERTPQETEDPIGEEQDREKEHQVDDVRDETTKQDAEDDYDADDPEPPPPEANEEQLEAYGRSVTTYSTEMLDAYRNTTLHGEALWEDFKEAFRPRGIRQWSRAMTTMWFDFLITRGIHLEKVGRKQKADAIITLLYREEHLPARRAERAEPSARQAMRLSKQETTTPPTTRYMSYTVKDRIPNSQWDNKPISKEEPEVEREMAQKPNTDPPETLLWSETEFGVEMETLHAL